MKKVLSIVVILLLTISIPVISVTNRSRALSLLEDNGFLITCNEGNFIQRFLNIKGPVVQISYFGNDYQDVDKYLKYIGFPSNIRLHNLKFEDLYFLKGNTNLESLTFGECNIESLRYLSECQNLKNFNISDSRLPNDLSEIKLLANLRNLKITESNLSSSFGLDSLNVETLDLRGSHLYENFLNQITVSKIIDIKSPSVSEEDVIAFKAKYPNIIIHSNYNTLNIDNDSPVLTPVATPGLETQD